MKHLTILLLFLLSGCMTHNQLEAEKAYYQMQTAAMRQQQKQQEAQPLWEMKSQQEGKPIVIENVDYIRVYQPLQQNTNEKIEFAQYRQMDYVSPWTNLLGKAVSIAVPAFAAYKIIDSVASNAGTHTTTNMNNSGPNSELGINGDTSISGSTVGGNLSSHSDFTHDPTVVRAPDPIIVEPPEPIVVEQPEPIVVPSQTPAE